MCEIRATLSTVGSRGSLTRPTDKKPDKKKARNDGKECAWRRKKSQATERGAGTQSSENRARDDRMCHLSFMYFVTLRARIDVISVNAVLELCE